jgi:hypothetical protein
MSQLFNTRPAAFTFLITRALRGLSAGALKQCERPLSPGTCDAKVSVHQDSFAQHLPDSKSLAVSVTLQPCRPLLI